MEEYLFYFYLAIISMLVLVVLWFFQQKQTREIIATERNEENAEDMQVRLYRARGNARARMRIAQTDRQQQERLGDHDDSAEEGPTPETTAPFGKFGKKKLAKLQLKADKKIQREAAEREREEKKAEDEKQWELRKIQDAKEKEEEKMRVEEEKIKKEEKDRKEKQEYESFKQQFSVQAEGYDEIEDKDLLKKFIEHIKNSKVVVLEELATEFKLRTQSVINRIVKLQESGRLTGVIDDRGKFIYISREELEKVAKFIKQRGRVSLSEIAEASNQLITLN